MKINLEQLNTEQQNLNTLDIDTCSTHGILAKINREDQCVANVVHDVIPAITKLVDAAYEQLKKGGRIIYVGAGTSGRLGILDASECPPTYGVSPQLVQGLIAGGIPAIFTAQEGAEDDEKQAIVDLQGINIQANDVVIGLAASGRTPYVKGALRYANELGAETGSVCCVENGEISSLAKYPVEAITGPEAITGSTRMKAGTAQKLILNMISTTCMVKMGKVYQNLMVDVQATNKKLEQRACGIIQKLAEVDEKEAERLFEKSEHCVKTAIVMGLSKSTKTEAKALLEKADGHITIAVQQKHKEEN